MTATGLLRRPRTGASAGRYAAWRRGVPRLWLLACGAALAALPFATAPGDIIADTKFELAVSPAGFLSGALTSWNPQQFGVLLNQAVGYLFPMGPFFELLRLARHRRAGSSSGCGCRPCWSPRSAARCGSPRGWASGRRGRGWPRAWRTRCRPWR